MARVSGIPPVVEIRILPRGQGNLTLSGFLVSALVAALLVAATYWMSVQESRAQKWIGHTYEVLATVAATRAHLLDIQNGPRGFAVTGDPADLQPYEQARAAVESDLRRLQELTSGNPVQQEHLRQLEAQVAGRLGWATAIVETRRSEGFEAAGRLIDSEAGRQQMAALREALQQMEAEESRALAALWHRHHRSQAFVWAGMAVLLVGLVGALAVLYRLVVQKHRAQQRLLEGEQQFHLMTDSVTDYAILLLDTEGRVRTWNPGAQRILGHEARDIVGQHFSRFYPEQDARDGAPMRMLEAAARRGRCNEEGWRVRGEGTRFWARVATTPLKDAAGRITGYCTITHDLTEHKGAEEQLRSEMQERTRLGEELRRLNAQLEAAVQERTLELQRSNRALLGTKERLQELSARLISAQEEERRHIARELHDETGQSLTLVRMQLAELAHSGADPARVAECARSVDHAVNHIRGLSLRLRPPMLDDLGLVDALEWVVEQQARAAAWRTRLQLQPLEDRLPGEVETACFRICQEALTNAARHAKAKEVSVALRLQANTLRLEVADDGRGFDLGVYRTPEERRKHFGLVSMSERAALAGGELEIDTAPGRGTRIRAVFALAVRRAAPPPAARAQFEEPALGKNSGSPLIL